MTTLAPRAIDIEGITYAYPEHANMPVIDIRKWQVAPGERVFIHGKSGSGKSTLLNLLCGTLAPDAGVINLIGQPFSRLSARKKDRFRAQHIGVVFQQFNLIPYLSVKENILLANYFAHQRASHQAEASLPPLLEHLHLNPALLDKPANALSVGQQQRVAIARSLINRPEIIIADEPTSSLDEDSQESFMSVLLDCVDDTNSTLLFVSHDQRLAQHFDTRVELTEINQAQGH